ncbi:YgjV family protein [Litorilituus sediminis]|uniref:YgjV family protein n=1 Tax=Litorilituus sediminis TaxID=718192 RepID=A0A4P6P0F4_9GAMM|nr:YgjV family protein [Litorilituus sediminis]QBG34343.1 YgjV family protein [Litorilituus sediminis]
MFLLSQILMVIAISLDIVSFQLAKRWQVLLALSASTALTSIHFYLLDVYNAALLMAIASLRYAVFIKYQNKCLLILFLLLIIIPPLNQLAEYYELYAIVGSALLTLGAFFTEQKRLRIVMMFGTLSWLIHNIYVGSPMAIALESGFLLSNIIGFYRLHKVAAIS